MLHIPAIILLGVATSINDYKTGRIPNTWVAAAIVCGIILNVYGAIQGTIELYSAAIYLSAAILFGFALFYTRIWSAGDGKLYIAYAFLIPITVYKQSWASVVLLSNIFLPGLAIILVLLLTKIELSDMKLFVPKMRTVYSSALGFFSIVWLIPINDALSRFLLVMIIFSLLQNLPKAIYLYLVLSILRIIIEGISFPAIYEILIFITIWAVVRTGLMRLSKKYFVKKVNTSKLRPGMYSLDIVENSQLKSLDTSVALTESDIRRLQKYKKKVRISQSIPFAPLIFLGALITIILGGNLLILTSYLA